MKITTKTGDTGESSLFNGKRLKKSDVVFHVLGDLDELNAFLGWCRILTSETSGKGDSDLFKLLEKLQDDIGAIMAMTALGFKETGKFQKITEEDIKFLEKRIKKCDGERENPKTFVKPGRAELSARLHLARCVCRRTERSFVSYRAKLSEQELSRSRIVLKYINRLSDLIFVLALVVGKRAFSPE